MSRAKEQMSSVTYLARDITHVVYLNNNIYASRTDMESHAYMLIKRLAACLEHDLNDGHGGSWQRHHCLDRLAGIRPFDHGPIFLRPLLGVHHVHHLHRLDG